MATITFKVANSQLKIENIPDITLRSVAVIDAILIFVSNNHTGDVDFAIAVDDDAVLLATKTRELSNLVSGIAPQQMASGYSVFVDLSKIILEDRIVKSHITMITGHASCVLSGTLFLSSRTQANIVDTIRDLFEEE